MSNLPGAFKRFFLNKKNLIVLGVVIFIILVVGINVYRVRGKDVVKVKTASVTQQKLVQTVLASGKVVASDKKVIYSQVTGTVKRVHVKMGQEVQPGQLLMELDIPDGPQKLAQARAALAKAESDLAKARASDKSLELIDAESTYSEAEASYRLAEDKLKRNQVLYEQGAISLESFQEIQSQFKSAESRFRKAEAVLESVKAASSSVLQGLEASVEGARASLELLERQIGQEGLKSDISGRVLSLGVREGDMVTPNAILVTIGNIDSLEITADINEADGPQLRIGQKVVITGSAIPDQHYNGRVTEVGLEARSQVKNDAESSDLPITVSLPRKTLLRPGYNVDLEITTNVDNKALVVPYEAVIEKKDIPYVYVIRDGTAHLQKVVPGIYDNFKIQIKTGLKKGDKVAIEQPPQLKEGSKVKPQ